MNNLRLITFDITETLLNFPIAPGVMYAKVGKEFGVCVDSEKIIEQFKKHWKYMKINHPNFGLKTIGWEKWWKEIVVKSFEGSLEQKAELAILNKIATHLVEIYKTPEGWETAKGAHELLAHLNNCNVPLGIISNFDDRLETIMKAMNLHHYFKFVITSYSSGFEKPDSHIFHLALSHCRIKSCNALHVGNTPDIDYLGAINAGWNAVLVHHDFENISKEFPGIKPEHVFQTLPDLQMYFIKNKVSLQP